MQTDKTYKVEFNLFMQNYKRGVTDGEEVGRMISRLTQFYADINDNLCDATTAYVSELDRIAGGVDDNGKAMAVNKATITAEATETARRERELKTDLKNVEQYINALKFLQKGILNEYSQMSNI